MKLKNLFLILIMMFGAVSYAANFDRGERRINISDSRKAVDQLEIVVTKKTPLLDFAVEELQRYIKKSTGMDVPVVSAPSGGKISLILGDNKFSRSAGIDISKLASEGFFIKRDGNNIYLAGADSDNVNIRSNPWRMWMKRGTLSAVYDFLERFVGVRFYFAGEYGTVVPKNKKLLLPLEIDIMDRPDLIDRTNYSGFNVKKQSSLLSCCS